jgi:uncharacterized protein (DUF2147 family)
MLAGQDARTTASHDTARRRHVSIQGESMIRFTAGALSRGMLACALFASATLAAAQTNSPVGVWQTIDDNTGQAKAVVQIVDDGGGMLSGRIVQGLGDNDKPERRCTACTDARKDQLIKGMTIITGMKQDGDDWKGGQILDPESGKLYKCKMHLEDGGQKLVVRGFIGVSLLGRSQTWIRQQ